MIRKFKDFLTEITKLNTLETDCIIRIHLPTDVVKITVKNGMIKHAPNILSYYIGKSPSYLKSTLTTQKKLKAWKVIKSL